MSSAGVRSCFWPTRKGYAAAGVSPCSCDESLALRRAIASIDRFARAGRDGSAEDARLALYEVTRLCRLAVPK